MGNAASCQTEPGSRTRNAAGPEPAALLGRTRAEGKQTLETDTNPFLENFGEVELLGGSSAEVTVERRQAKGHSQACWAAPSLIPLLPGSLVPRRECALCVPRAGQALVLSVLCLLPARTETTVALGKPRPKEQVWDCITQGCRSYGREQGLSSDQDGRGGFWARDTAQV